MKFDVRLQERALHFIAGLTTEQVDQLHHCIEALRLDPYIDNVTKFSAPYYPIILCLYQDGPFRIVYRLKDNHLVDILSISPAPYVPPIHQWDDWRKN